MIQQDKAQPQTKKLFLFDFDGVIADSLTFYEEFVNACLKKTGAPIILTREEYLDLFNGNFYESLRARGVDIRAFNDAALAATPEIDYGRIPLFVDLLPVICRLREQNTLLVISSNTSSTIRSALTRYGFDGAFDDVLGADFMLSKIDKIRHAVKKWNIARDLVYYVGDTVGDIKEGRAAGIQTVAATWGWHPRERLEGARPDYIADSPEDLLSI
ncbi:MAG TPA: HAD family hydrolase [Syntrophales bacterium]|nr:HAD family hydrolase [Syntrophales bacterium]HPQ42773.1 HAD family hydrolase [Syntrophales bacterium]